MRFFEQIVSHYIPIMCKKNCKKTWVLLLSIMGEGKNNDPSYHSFGIVLKM
jgi:hypothetical protein